MLVQVADSIGRRGLLMKRLLALVLIAVLAFALVGCSSTDSTEDETTEETTEEATEERDGPTVRVGSMLDSEGTILGAMVLQMLEANGIPTEDMTKLGTPDVVREALIQDEIDGTIEYTGNGQYYHEGEEGDPKWKNADEAYEAIRELDKEVNDIDWLTPAPANNSEYIATTRTLAEAEGLETMEDFAEYVNGGGEVTLIGSQKWVDNPLGLIGFEEAYGFEIAEDQLVTLATGNTAEMLTALARGTDGVNFSLTYGTDGQLNELDLIVLEDTMDVPPVYEPTPIFQGEIVEAYQDINDILAPVFLSLDQAKLQELNAKVAFGGEDPADVAASYLEENGFLE
jgi:osmoprotectant transport system substrate-binding protein